MFEYNTKTNLVNRLKKVIMGLINMPDLVKYIHKALVKGKRTIAVAESCTGGLISKILTDNPGSSKYFLLGVTAYSNQAKKNTLKIPASIISERGAASKETASLMAENIRRISGADLGIGVTGIAGPTGATPGKPIGTVFIAASGKRKTICRKFIFRGSRPSIRKQAALSSLKLLKLIL